MKKGGVTGSPAKRSRTGSSPEARKVGFSSDTPNLPVLDDDGDDKTKSKPKSKSVGKASGLGFPPKSPKAAFGGGPGLGAGGRGLGVGFDGGGGYMDLGGASQDWELPDVKSDDVTATFAPSWASAVEAQEKQHQQQNLNKAVSHNNSYHSQGSSPPQPKQFPYQQQHQQQTQRMHVPDDMSVITGASHPGTGFLTGGATVVSQSTTSSSNTGMYSNSTLSTASSGMFSQASMMSTASGGTPRSGGVPVGPFIQPPPPPQQQANPAGSTTTVPKAELYSFFGKKPRRKQLGNEDYMYWNNGAKPHELKFTAIFQDPLSGECFPSGRYGNPQFYEVVKTTNTEGREMEVVWYTKKAYAEHGAAARCYDCLRYRDALESGGPAAVRALHFAEGNDPPYTKNQSPGIPQVPPDVAARIESNRRRIQDFHAGFQK